MFIILGILITIPGAFMVIKTEWFLQNFGRISWFEKQFGTEGGSRLGYKLVGILFIFIGVVVMTGSGSNLAEWILGPLLKYNK